MSQINSMKLIPALVLAAFSGAANASGFQLLEQNASGISSAYAGSAAVAENASTIYFNPAGMTQLQTHEVSAGVAAVGPTFKFHNQGSSVGAFATAGEGGNAGGWSAIPNGYVSWALNKDVYVGVGFSAPFGLKTEYDKPWLGAAQATMFEIKTYNINPSIAYRVNDKVSLGAGLNWQRVEATYERQASIGAGAATPIKLGLDDDAWGWNVGALFTLSPSTKVGVSYRSTIQYHTEGRLDVANGGPSSADAKADLKLPDTFIMSVTQKLSDRWEMLGDVSWTGWSSIPKVDIMNVTTGSSTPVQTLETDFRDTWRVALGGNYKYNDAWKLKFGMAYDQTPVKRPENRLVSLPDNDRVWFSFGTQWVVDKASRLDLGLTYIVIKDSKIDNDQGTVAAPLRGRVTGEYTGNIWLLGAQYSMSF
ncbi:outer membrane protein transport protein [Propionivibrio sp.]|uniref:OmpP1/FadL family transporter n=1 Tax=Propionivibrio sp. TaxID=2212460 RepID=UPI00260B8F29|nr:outer membrane protein transport protein [Propionivibrio sp.]